MKKMKNLQSECQEPGKHLVVPKSTVQGSITDKVLTIIINRLFYKHMGKPL